jgi:membrane protein YdbS with pleckstrin-like domain
MRVFVVSAILFVVWLILTFLMHKSGFVHILLLSAVSLFVIQMATYRKTKYQANSSRR